MFQTFNRLADPSLVAARVAATRAALTRTGLDAFLVPRADEHQGEYVPPAAERLAWVSGFTGSAGLAIVTQRRAALFVDGRYTVQVRAETDTGIFELPSLPRQRIWEWIAEVLPAESTIGFDPWLHTAGEIARLGEALAAKGMKLKAVAANPVDRAWGRERPAPPRAPATPHPVALAGKTAADKIAEVQDRLAAARQDAVVLTLPDSICWLFNIRGGDVAHNPVVLAFAIVPARGKPELFIAPEKLTPEVREHLRGVAKLATPETLKTRVKKLREDKRKVRLDPETAAYWFARALGGPKSFDRGPDPCLALKARKTEAEIAGARAAHERDGAAVVRFLAWLDKAAAKGDLDEITAVAELERFRRETNELREISFDTISGSGPHGAIVHYRVTEATNRRLAPGELFLVDSGAQYRDGTTDITRTIAIGKPSAKMRERFTLVLKGHIAIATARFPKGTRGIDLDPFARRALWNYGLDYDHGTGHGVGSYLSVHEGPQSISRAGMVPLEPGMICSNEPGYYKEGAYGIRIENLVLVRPPERLAGSDRETLSFETLTLAPIDRRLVASELLEKWERAWLNEYHARVAEVLSPHLDEASRSWLAAATKPV
jgi:Xaa-Pro aminopeptidase